MQVILDSSFARPGSAPIWGRKKGEFRDWTRLNHSITFRTKVLVNGHSMNVCSMEYLSPQYRHLSSGLIPNLNSFVCYYNSMDEFKLKLFELGVLADVFQRLKILYCYLTIRLRARVFYEQIVKEAQPS